MWDSELAAVAQAHADRCRCKLPIALLSTAYYPLHNIIIFCMMHCRFVHDCATCRRVSRFPVGQNLLRDTAVAGGGGETGPDWGDTVTRCCTVLYCTTLYYTVLYTVTRWFNEGDQYPDTDNTAVYRWVYVVCRVPQY